MSARQSETVIRRHRSKPDESYNLHSHKGIWVNLTYPISRRGSHREWKGHEGTRHLQLLVCVPHGEHGRACQGCEGEWEGGRGDPARKLRGPAGSQIGHSSLHPGKLGTPGRGLMAKALRERVGKRYKGSQRTRKLTPVNVPWRWRKGSFL